MGKILYVLEPVGDDWTVGECVRAAGRIFSRQKEAFKEMGYEIVSVNQICGLDTVERGIDRQAEYETQLLDTAVEHVSVNVGPSTDVVFWLHELAGINTVVRNDTEEVIKRLDRLRNAHPRVSIVGWQDDLHAAYPWRQILIRIDALFCPYDVQYMGDGLDQFIPADLRHKVAHVPYHIPDHWFMPKQSWEEWSARMSEKVLLTGRLHATYYPLRMRYHLNPHVTTRAHHGLDTAGETQAGLYFDNLRCHTASIATCVQASPGGVTYCVAKYLEIAAAQTLLIAEPHPQMQDMGFKDGAHYLCLTDETVATQSGQSVKRTAYDIATRAYEHVKENHGEKSSVTRVVDVLNDRLLEPGLTLLIRARDESANVDMCFSTIWKNIKHAPGIKVVFVNHMSTDDTLAKAEAWKDTFGDQLAIFDCDFEVCKTGENSSNGSGKRTLAQYYNWCLDRVRTYNVAKWDADFAVKEMQLRNMVAAHRLETRGDDFSVWFTGETLFEHEGIYRKKINSFYDEFRIFSKRWGFRWADSQRWECAWPRGKQIKHGTPVFYEIKRTTIEEFCFRAALLDSRDYEDHHIWSNLRQGNLAQLVEQLNLTPVELE